MAWKAELKKYIPHNTAIKMNENTPRTKSALPLMTVLFKISQKKDEPKSCRFPFELLNGTCFNYTASVCVKKRRYLVGYF